MQFFFSGHTENGKDASASKEGAAAWPTESEFWKSWLCIGRCQDDALTFNFYNWIVSSPYLNQTAAGAHAQDALAIGPLIIFLCRCRAVLKLMMMSFDRCPITSSPDILSHSRSSPSSTSSSRDSGPGSSIDSQFEIFGRSPTPGLNFLGTNVSAVRNDMVGQAFPIATLATPTPIYPGGSKGIFYFTIYDGPFQGIYASQ